MSVSINFYSSLFSPLELIPANESNGTLGSIFLCKAHGLGVGGGMKHSCVEAPPEEDPDTAGDWRGPWIGGAV